MANSVIHRLPAPSPNAIEELTRPDGRVLVAGEHFDRLHALAEALLRTGCRVEVVGLPRPRGGPVLELYEYRLVVVDAVHLSRAAAADIHRSNAATVPTPIIAIVAREGTHHRVAAANNLMAAIRPDGRLADAARVARDILSLWTGVRPLDGPGDLRIDRVAQRATVGGRPLVLRPSDFRLLRMISERGHRGCTLDELREVSSNRRDVASRRAAAAVRRGVQRIRTALRRSNVTLTSSADGSYCLTRRENVPDRHASADTRS